MRLLLATILVFCAVLVSFTRVSASCNEFETIQSVILSEATTQPFDAQLEVARVANTHGACRTDSSFYTGYGIAERIRDSPADGTTQCIQNTHCRAYFLLYTISPEVRESAARAAHVALTEQPRVERFHFDNWHSSAYWWNALSACPSGWFIIGELKVC